MTTIKILPIPNPIRVSQLEWLADSITGFAGLCLATQERALRKKIDYALLVYPYEPFIGVYRVTPLGKVSVDTPSKRQKHLKGIPFKRQNSLRKSA